MSLRTFTFFIFYFLSSKTLFLSSMITCVSCGQPALTGNCVFYATNLKKHCSAMLLLKQDNLIIVLLFLLSGTGVQPLATVHLNFG